MKALRPVARRLELRSTAARRGKPLRKHNATSTKPLRETLAAFASGHGRATRILLQAVAPSLLEYRSFQPVEVAFAGSCLLKDVLRHFQRRSGLADQEAPIRDDLVQCLPHNGDRRRIEFLFQIIHRSQPKLLGAS